MKHHSILKWSALAVVCATASGSTAWAQPEQGIIDLPEGVDSIVAIEPSSGPPLVRATPGTSERGAVANEVQAQQGQTARGKLAMPEGIRSITAIDAFNFLLVETTGEDDEPIQTRVSALEKPMRQVQLDVRVIEAPKNALFSPIASGNPNSYRVTGDSDKFASLLDRETRGIYTGKRFEEQLLSGDARLANVGRVSSPNTRTAKLRWETSSSATLRSKDANGAPLLQSTTLTNSLLVSLKPTFNRDGTITIEIKIKSELQSDSDTPLIGFPRAIVSGSEINTITICKLGETITASGLRPSMSPHKTFSILPYGTVLNVDAPIEAKDDASPRINAEEKELYIEITASLATPQTQAATK